MTPTRPSESLQAPGAAALAAGLFTEYRVDVAGDSAHRANLGLLFEALRNGLRRPVEEALARHFPDQRPAHAARSFVRRGSELASSASLDDPHFLLLILRDSKAALARQLTNKDRRDDARQLVEARNDWAHYRPLTFDKVYEAFCQAERVLKKAAGAEAAGDVASLKRQLLALHGAYGERGAPLLSPADRDGLRIRAEEAIEREAELTTQLDAARNDAAQEARMRRELERRAAETERELVGAGERARDLAARLKAAEAEAARLRKLETRLRSVEISGLERALDQSSTRLADAKRSETHLLARAREAEEQLEAAQRRPQSAATSQKLVDLKRLLTEAKYDLAAARRSEAQLRRQLAKVEARATSASRARSAAPTSPDALSPRLRGRAISVSLAGWGLQPCNRQRRAVLAALHKLTRSSDVKRFTSLRTALVRQGFDAAVVDATVRALRLAGVFRGPDGDEAVSNARGLADAQELERACARIYRTAVEAQFPGYLATPGATKEFARATGVRLPSAEAVKRRDSRGRVGAGT